MSNIAAVWLAEIYVTSHHREGKKTVVNFNSKMKYMTKTKTKKNKNEGENIFLKKE